MVSSLTKIVTRLMPRGAMQRLCLKLLRESSDEWKAYCDLMVPPYDHWIEWHSGLGEGVNVLYALARAIKPAVIVEIGSARGKSTCALSLACRQNGAGKVYAIDPHDHNSWTDQGTERDSGRFLEGRLEEYGLSGWCQMIRAESQIAAQAWDKPIDLLFIDGDHTYEGVRRDFELFKPWMTERGIIAFHDTLWRYETDQRGYRDDIGVPDYMGCLQDGGYRLVNVPVSHGIALMHRDPTGFDFANREPGAARDGISHAARSV